MDLVLPIFLRVALTRGSATVTVIEWASVSLLAAESRSAPKPDGAEPAGGDDSAPTSSGSGSIGAAEREGGASLRETVSRVDQGG